MSHQPRKRFGQNFLHDQGVLDRISSEINPVAEDQVLEIGPGRGALTERLLKSGCKLHVVEIDRDLVAEIGSRFPGLPITSADMLKVPLRELNLAPPVRIVGNLPYNISTPLLFHLFEDLDLIRDMHFMLQLEVVERLAAGPGSKNYGRLSVMTQYHCDTQLLFRVNPAAFVPAPKVMSAIVRLQPRSPEASGPRANDPRYFGQLVNQAFSMRRKTLRNALRNFASAEDMVELEIDPSARPENLEVAQFVALANLGRSEP